MADTTETKVVAEPIEGSPEYDTAMAAKFDKNQEQFVVKTDEPKVEEKKAEITPKPEGIPDKFYDAKTGVVDVTGMAKSYVELEKGKGKAKAEPAPKTTETPDTNLGDKLIVAQVKSDTAKAKSEAEGATEADKTAYAKADEELTLAKAAAITGVRNDADQSSEAKKLAESKGFDFEKLSDEFMEHDGLTEDTYKALETAGIPKKTVDSYIEGQRALAAQWGDEGMAIVGGEAKYNAMIDWAAKALPKEESMAFDKAVDSDNMDQVKLAITGLKAKYEAAVGSEPKLLGGNANVEGSGYQSQKQMTTDMGDPRYETDPAFRAQVEAKLKATTAF